MSRAADKPKGKSGNEAGFSDYVSGTAGGFNKGLGVPVDLVTALLNAGIDGVNKLDAGIRRDAGEPPTEDLFSPIRAPFGGSEGFEKMGMVPPPPDPPLGQGLARVGEEFGAAVLPSMGL